MNRKENGISFLNLILCMAIVVATVIIFFMLQGGDASTTKISKTNEIAISNDTSIKVNTTERATESKEPQSPTSVNEMLSNSITDNNQSKVNYKKYFYSQINQNAKIIYDTLLNNMDELVSGVGTIEFDINEEGVENEFQSAWDAITMDNPEIFFVDTTKLSLKTQTTTSFFGARTTYKYILEPAEGSTYYTKAFTSQSEVNKAKTEIQNVANSVVNEAKKFNSVYEKVKYVHDYIINNTEYDEAGSDNDNNIYGALIEHKAVCEGYAQTLKYLLDKLDIPCVMVYGDGIKDDGSKEYHSWNYVKMEDNKWYAIDATWDDPIVIGNGRLPEKEKYNYFLKGSNSFSSMHAEEHDVSGTGQNFQYPELEAKNY